MEQYQLRNRLYNLPNMNQYITTSQENFLLKLPFNTNQLYLLEKNSISRIQIVSFKGIKAIKSFEDCYRKIRILIASLLIKILVQYSPSNADRLDRLKKIIYSAKLTEITEEKGIIRQHLLKLVAEEFKQIKIGHHVQMDIMRVFNCSPFFDEIVMTAIKEENPLIIESDCELEVWLDRELSVKILWNQQYFGEQKQEQLCLVGLGEQFHASKDCKSLDCNFKSFQQYLRFSTQAYYSNADEELSEIYDRVTKNQLFSCPMSPSERLSENKLFLHPSLYTSVESKSPSLKSYSKLGKEKQNKIKVINAPEIRLFDSPAAQPIRKKSSRASQNEDKNQKQIKVRRKSRKNEEGSFLWGILCCRNV